MRKIMITLLAVLIVGRGWEWYIQQASTKPLPEESRLFSEDDLLLHPIRTAEKLNMYFDN